jgi:hypothetical protein
MSARVVCAGEWGAGWGRTGERGSGLVAELVAGLVDGLVAGLVDGLLGGLVDGLVGGLVHRRYCRQTFSPRIRRRRELFATGSGRLVTVNEMRER